MKNKSEVLGMPISKASHRLNRDLIYWLGSQLGVMNCYRCGEPISREDFTIDHKVDWLDSDAPVDTFFDVENIAFSHLRCNIVAGHQNRPQTHGISAYNHRGCRCDTCRQAKIPYNKQYRRR
jgi:hypothetical protein